MLAVASRGMELLLSIALLALFIVGVELTSMGWTDTGLAGRLTGLFSSRLDLAWPAGVQEDDDHRWSARFVRPPADHRQPAGASAADVSAAEIIEDHVRPVPVRPVRRIR